MLDYFKREAARLESERLSRLFLASPMLRIEDALETMLGMTVAIDAEQLQLDRSLGRVLRESARADLDLPPFNRARMDGYALRRRTRREPPKSDP